MGTGPGVSSTSGMTAPSGSSPSGR
jgi:hypothetical protein